MSDRILPDLLPEHPRLIISNEDWKKVRERIASDAVSRRVFESLQKKADALFGAPPVTRVMEGIRLLAVSRLVLERVCLLAVVANVTGDERHARRAVDEVLAAARFTDWNPSHFLDVAEMALGVAIGLDWLHEKISKAERDEIGAALVRLALEPSLAKSPGNTWATRDNNWNQVCHGGLSAAAIVVADREPELAEKILRRAVENVPRVAVGYAPDGAYQEGPMYWSYGTSYHVVLIDALRRVTGKAFGLEALPGFLESANYMAQATTATGGYYSYSDCRVWRELGVPLFWFARELKSPGVVAYDLRRLSEYLDGYDKKETDPTFRFLPLMLFWREPGLDALSSQELPRSWMGRGVAPVMMHRSAWGDRKALFLGLKGGGPSAPHAHMDAGSFLLEKDGVRWALDLGLQEYESLEARGIKIWGKEQGSPRWTVFRLGAEGHNILRFNKRPQQVTGAAEFVKFRGDSPCPCGVVDLTSIYKDEVREVKRGVMALDGEGVLIQDEWTSGDAEVEVAWQMLTKANVTVYPGGFRLSQWGETMTFCVLDQVPMAIDAQEVAGLQQPHDVAEPGIKRVRISQLTPPRTSGSFRIVASPETRAAPERKALADW